MCKTARALQEMGLKHGAPDAILLGSGNKSSGSTLHFNTLSD